MADNLVTSSMPNTKMESSLLSENVIICCGEDEQVMMSALLTAGIKDATQQRQFRSYQIRKFNGFTVILSGIGTGSIEPLLHELFSFGIAKRLVLVGTAGLTPVSTATIGEVYIINEAYLAGTALDREIKEYPITPNFHLVDKLKTASIVSTDFYYGFKETSSGSAYQNKLDYLQRDVEKYVKQVDLVDMEVGQFYALCSLMSDISSVEYIAIKGPSNQLSKHDEQNTNSLKVLSNAFKAAFEILNIVPARIEISTAPVPRETNNKDSNKIIEEIKLYWTIQIASASMLGFLASHIDLANKFTTVIVCFPAFLLLTIGAIYNIVGNYYIRIEGERASLASTQENVITPHLCLIYWSIGAILGGVLGYCVGWEIMAHVNVPLLYLSYQFSVIGALCGLLSIYVTQQRTYRMLYKSGSSDYRRYSEMLRKFFGPWRL